MPSWKKVITSGSSAHLSHVTASANISGSSTSTGSFGRGFIAGNLQVDGGQGTGVAIGPLNAGNADDRKLTIVGYDEPMIEFETHGGWGRQQIIGNYGGTLKMFNSGSTSKELTLQLGHDQERQGGMHVMHSEYDTIKIGLNGSYPIAYFGAESGSNNYHGSAVISSRIGTGGINKLYFTDTNIISGSATSTGSFGKAFLGGALQVEGAQPGRRGISITGGSVDGTRLMTFTETNNISSYYDAFYLNANFGGSGATGNNISLETTFGHKYTFGGDGTFETTGHVSGSSTSTGSFGHVKLGDYNAPRTLEITAGNNQDAEIRLHNTNNTIGHSIVMNDSSNRAMYFKYHNGSSTGTTYMTFDGANGNVGIGGAIDPNTDLQIGGYSGTRAVTIATGNNEDAELRFHNTNNTIGHSIVFNDSSGRSLYFKRHSGSSTGTTYMTMNGTTGDVEFAGNISGSSITTGSFGHGYIDSKLGIGTTSPVEALHVAGKAYIRRTGTATAHGDTDLFVADSTAGGSYGQLQILGGATGASLLYFSDTNSYSVGGIRYYHSDNRMNFRANDTDILDITSTKISGSATSTGSFGHIVTNGHIIPTAAESFDLGSETKPFRDLHVSSGSIKMYAGTTEIARIQVSDDDEFEFFSTKDLSAEQKKTFTKAQIRSNATPGKFRGGNIGTTTSDAQFNHITGSGNISGSATSTGSFGHLLGDASQLTNLPSSGVTISNNSNNRILTGDGSNANAESNLTFDGAVLAVSSSANSPSPTIQMMNTNTTNESGSRIEFFKNATADAGDEIGAIDFYHRNTNNEKHKYAFINASQYTTVNGQEGAFFSIRGKTISVGNNPISIIQFTGSQYGTIRLGEHRSIITGSANSTGSFGKIIGNTFHGDGSNITGTVGAATTATTATNVTLTSNNSSNETVYLTFADGTSGTQGLETDSGLNYNPSTEVLHTTTFDGALSGNATSATTATNVSVTANNTANENNYVPFVDGTSGAQGIETDSALTYNPSTNTLAATTFSGNSTTATTATNVSVTANNSENATLYLPFVDGTSGAQGIETDSALTYNPSTNILTAGTLSGNATTATTATNVSVTANNTANETIYLTFVDGTSGAQGIETDSALTYNPSTNTIAATTLSGNATSATTATNVTLTANNTTNETVYITFADGSSGAQGIETDSNLTYNPSTNILTAGTLSGNATTATTATNVTATANNSENAALYLTFVDGASGAQGIETDSTLRYNPSTDTLTATNLSGNASTATTATTATNVTATANNSTNEQNYITFIDGASGGQGIETDSTLRYNPSNNALTASILSATGDATIGDDLYVEGGLISLKNTGTQSQIRLYCESSNAHWVGLQAPAHSAFSGNVAVTLPATATTLIGTNTTDTLTNKTIGQHLLPDGDNTRNLGSSNERWANLFTGDLHLSNEGGKGNDVDKTTGDWTIQEGQDDLYLFNNKSGKKYKFKLEEL